MHGTDAVSYTHLTYGGITHILYFAIDEQYREHGYGSEALKLMHTLYPKNRFI